MRFKSVIAFLFLITACSTAVKDSANEKYFEKGHASWYGPGFHGRTTASGQKYNMYEMTAAHKTLKFGTRVKVVSESSGKSVIVRINDRGPFIKGRIIDLSKKAAQKLGIIKSGWDQVKIYILN